MSTKYDIGYLHNLVDGFDPRLDPDEVAELEDRVAKNTAAALEAPLPKPRTTTGKPKRWRRRSVSVSRKTYARLQALAEHEQRPMSAIVQSMIERRCDQAQIPHDLEIRAAGTREYTTTIHPQNLKF